MESEGEPGKICISERTLKVLEEAETCDYTFDDYKDIEIKSLGIYVPAYFVNFQVSDE